MTGSLPPGIAQSDRRSKQRIYAPFPIRVRGVDINGERFATETTVDNLSAGGLYLRIERLIAPRAKLFLIIRLSNGQSDLDGTVQVALRGTVKRAEVHRDGSCGLAVRFTQHRFL